MQRVLWALSGVVLTIAVMAAVVFITTSVDDRENPRARFAESFGMNESEITPWSHASEGVELAWAHDRRGNPTLLHRGAGSAGGMTFVTGWAVEAYWFETKRGMEVVAVTTADAASVRFGGPVASPQASTQPLPGDPDKRAAAWHFTRAQAAKIKPNSIMAFDAKSRLLGRQHYNDGHGGFGKYNGLYDRKLKQR